jgi:hypothetical protein
MKILKDKIITLSILAGLFLCLSNSATASGPLGVSVMVNGVDALSNVVDLSAGQNVTVTLSVSNSNTNRRATLLGVNVSVEPKELQPFIQAAVDSMIAGKSISVEPGADVTKSASVTVPDSMPPGDYKMTLQVRYVCGEDIYTDSYAVVFRVSDRGLLYRFFHFWVYQFPTDFIAQASKTLHELFSGSL